ncbi:SDR family NAD(P)-dependent oxidoreductase [Streptomyces sp. NPDC097981]|uniref:SDR family NAD(P)-dependent oxidoreductase n=1 Tax=Streptomyces sp. NPDC097981 TaxID=3155428 RepID=UPI00331656BA
MAGRLAFAGSAACCATKFGVVAFSEALRQEPARQHVRVSPVGPGSVDTELREHNAGAGAGDHPPHLTVPWKSVNTGSGWTAGFRP